MRATDPIIRLRIEDVLRIRLDGAEGWDVRRYVAEMEAAGTPPWAVPEGGKPLSERQIRRYVEAADRLIDESCRTSRKKALRRHLAQRRSLYARALNKGDERTALAVLADLAALEGLYPPKGVRVSGKAGSPVVLQVVEEVVGHEPAPQVGQVVEEVVSSANNSGTDSGTGDANPDSPAPPGTANLPPQ